MRQYLFFPNLEGDNCQIVSRNSSGLKVVEYDYHSQDWYKKANLQQTPIYFYSKALPPYLNYINSFPIISGCLRIKDPYTKKVLGIIRVDLRASKLLSIFNDNKDDYFTIKDSNGYVINGRSNSVKKESVLSSYISSADWNLEYHRGTDFQVHTIMVSVIFIFVYLALALMMSILFYHKITSSFVVDMDSLLKTILEYQKGNFKERARLSSNDYVGSCILALNEMGERTEKLITQEYLSTINRQKAEFQTLQAQINPHFLYNTLNSFIALNRMGEVDRLEKGLIILTKLFRYTCSNKSVVSLKEEGDFINQYLSIQKEKYEDRLNWEIIISKEAETIGIPKLLLQPLIENAVIHAIEPIIKEVTIKIDAQIIDKYLVIEVSDNGAGCALSDLFKGFTDKTHIALKNVLTRLLLFSPNSQYRLWSEKAKGVKIVLMVNLKEA